MKQEHKDKTLSSIVGLITLTLVVYLVFQSGIVDVQEGKTLKDLFSMLMAQYLDFVIISYVFLCFQLEILTSSLWCGPVECFDDLSPFEAFGSQLIHLGTEGFLFGGEALCCPLISVGS